MSPQADKLSSIRLKVHAIAGADMLGNFSLRQDQVPPFNAFLPADELNRTVGETNKANLFLAANLESHHFSKLANWCYRNPGLGRPLLRLLNVVGMAQGRPSLLEGTETVQVLNESLDPPLCLRPLD